MQLAVSAYDRRGLLRDLTDVLAVERLSIDAVTSRTDHDTGIAYFALSVAVNDLEKRGFVVRTPHPTNGRMKLVSLTAKGRDIVAKEAAVAEHAPAAVAQLSADDLRVLARVVELLAR